jgi:putative CocE/NonD family hydrolase
MGDLSPRRPTKQEPDRYTYNPATVQISKELKELTEIGTGGSTRIRFESHDEDVLIYKTTPMAEPVDLGGPIELDLYFSTSAKDTDFFAFMVDIDEQETMRLIGIPGKIRARYLEGWDKPKPLRRGQTYRATIALWDTAHRLKRGHRLGILIQSQMFPHFARNLNTGEPIKTATRMVAAHQTIYHDARRPSALRFRVLPATRQNIAGDGPSASVKANRRTDNVLSAKPSRTRSATPVKRRNDIVTNRDSW